ncbi:OPT/YSL family transporter [Rivibacter subsaxonicus]|uniref:Putative oligopeptide transporter (OPT) family protein n=1 Tax=Rivibacter subsaxonicus TaxID=457575 RepID=A0A4Q7VWH3_9BURK|nr:OPT/YSL family transporter [Rivibacter subsaxonicus]RZU01084.1 putative oligopeptide transporter (OPT) family protein [Rivibacter subsaxonicus]
MNSTTLTATAGTAPQAQRWAWLPPIGSWQYYTLLALLGIFILGPLGGVTASYMNFSIGFFVGGQVLAGILGSTVTLGYGPEGKHGANYMQTAAASVAGMSAMGVLIQAMIWMGLPQPPLWELMLFFGAIGMFGAGVGMLYTPILVDRLQLTFPSGLAVANILRALTDPVLLRRSIVKLGTGMGLGIAGGLGAAKLAFIGVIELSTSTLGAGMLVGARIGIPAIVAGLLGSALIPYFVSIDWLAEGQPFRKITFLIGLGLILGAAIIDLAQIGIEAVRRIRSPEVAAEPQEAWKKTSMGRLIAWVLFFGAAVVWIGADILQQPVFFMAFAVALVFVFAMVNGISLGISDSNPISSAFVVSVVLMAALGLKDPGVGLMAGAILLIACSVGGDMQQDRSTGWRLGTPRTIQFRFQVMGIIVGAILSVGFAHLFMTAYPVLKLDQTVMSAAEQPAQWSSAMTYKFVGALRSLTDDQPHQRTAIWVGIALGFVFQAARKWLFSRTGYQRWKARGRAQANTDFVLDAVLLPSPYAFSFGCFLSLATSAWFAIGGVISSAVATLNERRQKNAKPDDELPSDMSSTSLIGGGLIAGDALAALGLGIVGLMATVLG